MWLGSKFTSLSDSLFKSLFRFLFRYDIFISYARSDGKEYALKLRDQLKQLDFSCFLDYDELPPGNSLNNTLRRALMRSAALVVVGTERAVKSRYVELEVGEFAGTGRAIIPIDMEGTLAEMPWPVVKERDLVWIDEVKSALAKATPSPAVADSIDKLFKYTRRNSRVRAQVLATIALFVVVVVASLFMIRQQVNAATRASANAKRQEMIAIDKTAAADAASADAAEQKRTADAATSRAEDATAKADAAGVRAMAAEKAAGEAALEAKTQERKALANAERAKAEQAIAEERTRYVRSQQLGVQADLALTGRDNNLEKSVLLSVESLKVAFTPEGYGAWAKGMELLPRPVEIQRMGNAGNVSAVEYSPDGSRLAEGGDDGALTLFQTNSTTQPVKLLPPLGGPVKVIAFGGDGSWVAAASTNELRVWELKTFKPIRFLKDIGAESIAFSPDGRYVATADRRYEAQVLDTRDGSVVARPDSDSEMFIMCVAFSPDGRWLATGVRGGKLLLWDVADFAKVPGADLKPVASASAGATVYTVAFSPRGQYLASADSSGAIGIWHVSAEDDGKTMQLVDVPQKTKISGESERIAPLVFSPDEAYIAASLDSTPDQQQHNFAHIWEVVTGREVSRVGLGKALTSLAFSPDGRAFATAAGDVAIWEASFGSDLFRLEHRGAVHSLNISPGGRWLVTAGENGVRVFQTAGWSQVAAPENALDVSRTVFSPDARWLAAESKDKVAVFDTSHWTKEQEFTHLSEVSGIGFSPDGRWLIIVSGSLVKLIEVCSWKEVHTLKHTAPVSSISFNQDGQWLAVRTRAKYGARHHVKVRVEMYVWNTASGLPAACMLETGEPAPSTKELTTDAGVICSDVKGGGQKALLSEAQRWKELLHVNERNYRQYQYPSPDGRWLADLADANNRIVLSFKEGNAMRQVAKFENTSADDLIFTPDGRWLVSTEGGMVKVWPLQPADMIDEACTRLRRLDLTSDERKTYLSRGQLLMTCSPK
jgi:WD40 repeat protein